MSAARKPAKLDSVIAIGTKVRVTGWSVVEGVDLYILDYQERDGHVYYKVGRTASGYPGMFRHDMVSPV